MFFVFPALYYYNFVFFCSVSVACVACVVYFVTVAAYCWLSACVYIAAHISTIVEIEVYRSNDLFLSLSLRRSLDLVLALFDFFILYVRIKRLSRFLFVFFTVVTVHYIEYPYTTSLVETCSQREKLREYFVCFRLVQHLQICLLHVCLCVCFFSSSSLLSSLLYLYVSMTCQFSI